MGRLSAALPVELERLREAGAASAVLLDVTGLRARDARLSDTQLAWLASYELPTVCAFEGGLEGGALSVALACDIRIGGGGASIAAGGPLTRWTAMRLRTLAGDDSATVHPLRAGERFDAEECLRLGLISEVTRRGEAGNRGAALAATIASRGPIAVRLAKEAIWRGLAMPFAQALRFETDLTLLLQTTKDRSEGVRAFAEKRPSRFTGD